MIEVLALQHVAEGGLAVEKLHGCLAEAVAAVGTDVAGVLAVRAEPLRVQVIGRVAVGEEKLLLAVPDVVGET